MPLLAKDEALAFIQAMRLTLEGKVGFRWMAEKLAGLAAYVESIETENAHLNAFVDSSGARGGYEVFRATRDAEPEDTSTSA